MVISFLLGAAAGWFSTKAEPQVESLLQGILPNDPPISEKEKGLFSLAVCVFLAGVLAALTGSSSALGLGIGVMLGALGPRLMAKYRGNRIPDYDS